MTNSTHALPSTTEGHSSTSSDVWGSGPVGSQPLHNSAADAAAARQARLDMVEEARVRGEIQAKRPQLPNMDRNIFDLVPEEHRGSLAAARAYLDSMMGKADGGNPRNMDSSNVGALPLDANILSDVRSPYGAPRNPSNATDEDVVIYRGVRISVGEAISQNLLQRDRNGFLSVPDGAARDAAENAKQQQANAEAAAELQAKQATGDEPDAQTIQVVEMINSVVPPQVTQAFLQDAVNNDGTLSTANLHQVAKSTGLSVAAVMTLAEGAHMGFTRQATALALNAGIAEHEVSDAWGWAQQIDPIEHATAVRAFLGGDTSRLRRLLAQYKGRNNGQ